MEKELVQLINKLQNSIVQEQEVLDNPTGYHYNDVLQARTIVNTTKFAIKEINELIKQQTITPTTNEQE